MKSTHCFVLLCALAGLLGVNMQDADSAELLAKQGGKPYHHKGNGYKRWLSDTLPPPIQEGEKRKNCDYHSRYGYRHADPGPYGYDRRRRWQRSPYDRDGPYGPPGGYYPEGPGNYHHEDSAASEDYSCEPGRGGDRCHICPEDTYSPGGKGSKCSNCPTGTKAPAGSRNQAACIPAKCADRGFKGISLPADGTAVVLSDVPAKCAEVPAAEILAYNGCMDNIDNPYLSRVYYYIEKAPKSRVIALDVCAQNHDPFFVYASSDRNLGVYKDDDWDENTDTDAIYDRAELRCNPPGGLYFATPYLEVTLEPNTAYVVIAFDEVPFTCIYMQDPIFTVPFVTTIRVLAYDGKPVTGRQMSFRTTPVQLSAAGLGKQHERELERERCMNKAMNTTALLAPAAGPNK